MFCQNLWWLGALPLGARAFYTSDMYHGWKKPEASDGAKASLLASLDESEQSLLASLASPAAEPAVAALVEAIGEDGGLVEAIGGSVFHALRPKEAHETAAGVCVFASGSAQIDGWRRRRDDGDDAVEDDFRRRCARGARPRRRRGGGRRAGRAALTDGSGWATPGLALCVLLLRADYARGPKAFLKTTLGNVARPTVAAVLALEACRRCLFATFWKAVAWGLGELDDDGPLLRKLAVEEALGGLALCAVAACETPARAARRARAVALASTAWIVRLAYAHGGATAALQAVALALRTAKRTTQALLHHGASLALAASGSSACWRATTSTTPSGPRTQAHARLRARLAYHREWAAARRDLDARSLFAPADDDAVRAYDDICVICHDGFAVAARDENGARRDFNVK
ncbi:hypothetical protein JL720_14762 [Aureococcus anophagefferens]|nr:hypothetical protein JL720_14762 [Aureococcus anophagefferens]